MRLLLTLLGVVGVSLGGNWDYPQTYANRQTMVHLFEWKWTDIASECENFLQYYGYGAVQVSPPNEHLTLESNGNRPWWIRYQPVSYKLQSRSGTRAQFIDMVERCNKVGVRIIVDAVTNHMVGVGQKSGTNGVGSTENSGFDGDDGVETFPGVPYSNLDFNDKYCHRDIQGSDYSSNAWAVRTCRLVGLLDLTQGNPYVAGKISGYMQDAISIGVAGFRVDAAKHQWPNDLCNIYGKAGSLSSQFGNNAQPFFVGEVIDLGGEAVKADDYLSCGRVTNFRYGHYVANAVRKSNNFKYFTTFGQTWNMWDDEDVLNFIDNHDNQRTDSGVLTYKNGDQYAMGVTYMLAWTYGYPRVMSSYYFSYNDQGPPSTGSPNFYTTSPSFNGDQTCASSSGWVCEHRWPQIRRMVDFRSVVTGTKADNFITDDHRIAFSRGNKGFFMVNNNGGSWNGNFYTALPSGTYCDVISGEVSNGGCTGSKVSVDGSGHATISVQSGKTFAIHVGGRSKIGGSIVTPSPAPGVTTTPSGNTVPVPSGFTETVIFMYDATQSGQNLFIRGGTHVGTCPGNDNSLASNPCAVPIRHVTQVPSTFLTYIDWEKGDNYLDWNGAEPGQGTYNGEIASGTPMAWSTNDASNPAYQKVNTFGPNYWIAVVKMDCSKTNQGWFELKGYQPWAGGWEGDISQTTCTGTGGGKAPFPSINHVARCGYLNVFRINENGCIINTYSP